MLIPDLTADFHLRGARAAGKTVYKPDDGNGNTGTAVMHRRAPRGTKLFSRAKGSSDEENNCDRTSGASRGASRHPSRRGGSRSKHVSDPGYSSDREREKKPGQKKRS